MARKGQYSDVTEFLAKMNDPPGEWFRCPPQIAPTRGFARGVADTMLDPSMYDLYRLGDWQGPLYARRKPIPEYFRINQF